LVILDPRKLSFGLPRIVRASILTLAAVRRALSEAIE